MIHLIVGLLEVWRARYRLLLPMIVLPAVAVGWSMANSPIYQATTTLSVERAKPHSPLLQNMTSQESQEILKRFVNNPDLLEDTLLATGVILPTMNASQRFDAVQDLSQNLHLHILDSDRLQLNYEGGNEQEVIRTLEKLSANFVDEILAPERLRVEQVLFSLSEQIRYYGELEGVALSALEKAQEAKNAGLTDVEHTKSIVRLEFDAQRSRAQRQLAQKEYDQLFSKVKLLQASMSAADSNGVFWFVEEPTLVGAIYDSAYHAKLVKIWLWLGFLVGLVWLVVGKISDSSLRREEDIYNTLGVKVLGRLPNLGHLKNEDGHLNIAGRS